ALEQRRRRAGEGRLLPAAAEEEGGGERGEDERERDVGDAEPACLARDLGPDPDGGGVARGWRLARRLEGGGRVSRREDLDLDERAAGAERDAVAGAEHGGARDGLVVDEGAVGAARVADRPVQAVVLEDGVAGGDLEVRVGGEAQVAGRVAPGGHRASLEGVDPAGVGAGEDAQSDHRSGYGSGRTYSLRPTTSPSIGSSSPGPSTRAATTVTLSGAPRWLARSISAAQRASGSSKRAAASASSSRRTVRVSPSEQRRTTSPRRSSWYVRSTRTTGFAPSAWRIMLPCALCSASSSVRVPASTSVWTKDWSRVSCAMPPRRTR